MRLGTLESTVRGPCKIQNQWAIPVERWHSKCMDQYSVRNICLTAINTRALKSLLRPVKKSVDDARSLLIAAECGSRSLLRQTKDPCFFMEDFRELSPQKGACQLWEKKRLAKKCENPCRFRCKRQFRVEETGSRMAADTTTHSRSSSLLL